MGQDHSFAASAGVYVAVLACSLLLAAGGSRAADATSGRRLWQWVVERGAEVGGLAFGDSYDQDCRSCPPGMVASRDLQEGDVIFKAPLSAVLQQRAPSATTNAAELARVLLERMHSDPSFNATWAPLWDSQPGPDSMLAPELFTDDLLEALQTPELARMVRHQRQLTEQVYAGTHPSVNYVPFNEVVPESVVSLDTFKWVSALLNSHWWASEAVTGRQLVPLLDCLQHSDLPNAGTSEEADGVLLSALEPIAKGEAITLNYQPGVLHRPDMALFLYGIVLPQEQPLLAAVDLPDFDPSNPFKPTPLDDSIYENATSGYVTWDEYGRLGQRLHAMGTQLSRDEWTLEHSSFADWRQKVVLQYRIQRKKALDRTLHKLAAGLEEPSWPFEAEARMLHEPEPQEEAGFSKTFWILAVAGGVNSLAAVALALAVNRLAVAVQASADAAAAASETAVALVELSAGKSLQKLAALAEKAGAGAGSAAAAGAPTSSPDKGKEKGKKKA